MSKRQIRVVWNLFLAGILVLLACWIANRLFPDDSSQLDDPNLTLYANGLVSEDGTLQLYVEKSNNDKSKINDKERMRGQQRNRPSVPRKKPTMEDIEAYRRKLQHRKDMKKGKNSGIDMSALEDNVIDQYIANGEPEEELRKVHPKIRKAFLRKVIQRKKDSV